MKTLEEKIEVMQAFLDGKTIQDNIDGEWADWISDKTPDFQWDKYDYRIKPENKQVPFEISDYESKLGKIMRHTFHDFKGILIGMTCDTIIVGNCEWDITPGSFEWYNDLLNHWEPCSKTVKG